MSFGIRSLMAGLIALGWLDDVNKEDELKDIDIEKEVELIKQKKSNLTKRQREIIMYRYNEKQKEDK